MVSVHRKPKATASDKGWSEAILKQIEAEPVPPGMKDLADQLTALLKRHAARTDDKTSPI